MLSDGVPEPEATFYQLYNVDRVEALKGPGAFLYGGNPLSGTINLVRKRPDPASNFARVNASLGSFSTYRATLDASRALPDQGHALRHQRPYGRKRKATATTKTARSSP